MNATTKFTLFAVLTCAIGTRALQGQASVAQTGSGIAKSTINADLLQRFAVMAPQIARSANLRPGQRVIIRGTASMLPVMEQLALETERAGAVTTLWTTTDRIEHARRTLPSSEQLQIVRVLVAEQQANDVTFTFPMMDDFTPDSVIRPEQQRTDSAIGAIVGDARHAHPWRDVFVMVPTRFDTVNTSMTVADILKMRMDAMASDYARIAKIGRAIRDRLAAAKQIRLTTPEGTDLTFSLVRQRVRLSAGVETAAEVELFNTLPGGEVYALVESASSSGAIRAPWDWCSRPVENESIDIDGGRPTRVAAGSDEECVRKAVEPLRLGLLSIGLNPASDIARTGARAPVNDFYGAGMVALGLGPAARVAAGDAQAAVQWIIPIPHATVLVDGVPVVRDGQLTVPKR